MWAFTSPVKTLSNATGHFIPVFSLDSAHLRCRAGEDVNTLFKDLRASKAEGADLVH